MQHIDKYEYFLCEDDTNGCNLITEEREYNYDKKIRREGLDGLIDAGLVLSFREEKQYEEEIESYVILAICKIDENKLMGTDTPQRKKEEEKIHKVQLVDSEIFMKN